MKKAGRERGMTLVGMLVSAVLVVMLAQVVLQAAPAVLEYFTIVKATNALAAAPELKDAGVGEIRMAFAKRAEVDNIQAVAPADLAVSKEGNNVVIAFAYAKKIPLLGPVSLLIDFQSRTKPGL